MGVKVIVALLQLGVPVEVVTPLLLLLMRVGRVALKFALVFIV